jgi:type III pantothenate kinase
VSALLLDIGNTRLKWGEIENGAIRHTGHIALQKIHDDGLGALTSKLPRDVSAVSASNVAGTSFATRLSGVIGMHCSCDVHFARSERQAFGVTNSYRQPRRMGVDRWVAMIGAWAELESACVIVDAGTAVTIDVVDDDGQHLGGQILPGVALMSSALADETSDIPKSGRRRSAFATGMDIFASDTTKAVACGTQSALLGAIERSIKVLRSNGYDPTIILTGGDASRILKSLGETSLHRPHLVLQGLAHMLEIH